MTRLPNDYEIKTSTWGNYTRFNDGDTKLRILTSPIMWYQYFTKENKPKRSKKPFENTSDIKDQWKVKEFWAFVVYNYETEKLEVCEIAQNSIKWQLFSLSKDSDYGDPKQYDIKINRSGKDLDTKYQVKPLPPKDFDNKEMLDSAKTIKLEALYEWKDPFETMVKSDVAWDDDSVPF